MLLPALESHGTLIFICAGGDQKRALELQAGCGYTCSSPTPGRSFFVLFKLVAVLGWHLGNFETRSCYVGLAYLRLVICLPQAQIDEDNFAFVELLSQWYIYSPGVVYFLACMRACIQSPFIILKKKL